MAINDEVYNRVAIAGEVAGVAISLSIALDEIADCLDAIRRGDQIDQDVITHIRSISEKMDKTFETLTGWTKEPR